MLTMDSQYAITPEKEASKAQYFYRQLLVTPRALPRSEVDLTGKTALITGASTGLGLETARQLLDLGLSKLIIAVRDIQKGEAARDSLLRDRPQHGSLATCEVDVWNVDLAVYGSIQQMAERARKLDRLDIVILNAGVFKASETFNPDTGYENSIQVNFLSNALLLLFMTRILKTKAPGPSPGRLVLVSSDTAAWAQFKERDIIPLLAAFKQGATRTTGAVVNWNMQERYATSKLLGQIFLTELANRIPGHVVTIVAANPGFCYGTELGREGKMFPLLNLFVRAVTRILGRSCVLGARVLVHAACGFADELENVHGQYVEDGEIRPKAPIIYKIEGERIAKRLWEETLSELAFAGVEECIQELVE
ncbi:hypothetical protein HK57_00393 [Aspergillus ustus]|uniref:Short-chain dehydrogenase n=1 Tax=Aspergillus ustus TaxID=40382 RepID=A0A0C1EGK5_ASPUT|nr:hypothetical protein HK57_00393 [Aspergillus ustus]